MDDLQLSMGSVGHQFWDHILDTVALGYCGKDCKVTSTTSVSQEENIFDLNTGVEFFVNKPQVWISKITVRAPILSA